MKIISGLHDYLNSMIYPTKWFYLAYMDVLLRYKRTLLGPWWVTLGIGIIILTLSSLWPIILSTDLSFFVPYFTIGYIIWHWIQTTILESSSTFIEFEGLVKQIKIPISTYLLRISSRNFIIFLHNITLIAIALFYFQKDVNFNELLYLSLPSLLLIFISINSIGIILAILSIRYRDLVNIVGFSLQLIFFLTPIIWHASIIEKNINLIEWNIIFHWIELLRQPLLGLEVPDNSFHIVLLFTIFTFVLSCFVIGKYRSKIIFWL
tara:strand:+ start:95 stop:886 length:792 start_codon:yes stop_codon:yes gene_type:complete